MGGLTQFGGASDPLLKPLHEHFPLRKHLLTLLPLQTLGGISSLLTSLHRPVLTGWPVGVPAKCAGSLRVGVGVMVVPLLSSIHVSSASCLELGTLVVISSCW